MNSPDGAHYQSPGQRPGLSSDPKH